MKITPFHCPSFAGSYPQAADTTDHLLSIGNIKKKSFQLTNERVDPKSQTVLHTQLSHLSTNSLDSYAHNSSCCMLTLSMRCYILLCFHTLSLSPLLLTFNFPTCPFLLCGSLETALFHFEAWRCPSEPVTSLPTFGGASRMNAFMMDCVGQAPDKPSTVGILLS